MMRGRRFPVPVSCDSGVIVQKITRAGRIDVWPKDAYDMLFTP
jgi:hypothetical protein